MPLEVCGQIFETDANRMADADVLEVAALAESIHGGGGHPEQLGDLADRKQRFSRTPARKML